MTLFTIVRKDSMAIELLVGPEHGGYSCAKVVDNICLGSTNRINHHRNYHRLKIITLDYRLFSWYIILSDQDIINSIQQKDKSLWETEIIRTVFQAALDNDELCPLISATINNIASLNFKKGRQKQAQDVLNALGINLTPELER